MTQQDMNILFVHILFSYNTVALTNCCNGKTYSLQSEYSCLEICQPKLFNLFEKVNGPFPSTLILIVYTVHDKLLMDGNKSYNRMEMDGLVAPK